MEIETIAYQGWENCYRLHNGTLEVIVTADVGPRIIHFGYIGGENVFKQFPDDMGQKGGDEYRFYGGHRVWHAPENRPRTYSPDNDPVDHFELDGIHYFVPPPEASTGIQKQLAVNFNNGTVVVDHTLTNTGLWSVELAPWAVTMMRPGGIGIMPLPPHVSHELQLLPTHSLALWGYTSLNDRRLYFGDKYILVLQTEEMEAPLKIGLQVIPEYVWSVGWLAYVNHSTMFVKSFHPADDHEDYPDLGSQVELFANGSFLELETLGYNKSLRPDESVKHREYWSLHQGVPMPETDADIGQNILPLIRQAHPMVGRRKTGTLRPPG
jgi:hypothetical protein